MAEEKKKHPNPLIILMKSKKVIVIIIIVIILIIMFGPLVKSKLQPTRYISSSELEKIVSTSDLNVERITYNGIAYMKFHAKEMIAELSKYEGNMELEVIGRGNINKWGGRKTPQIFIDNYNIIQLKDNNILDF